MAKGEANFQKTNELTFSLLVALPLDQRMTTHLTCDGQVNLELGERDVVGGELGQRGEHRAQRDRDDALEPGDEQHRIQLETRSQRFLLRDRLTSSQ